ncbi:ABC transporter ATP-binding protein [Gammaproteobacteria bacterium]|jgi:putative ABC transport system ATP-binding protein|nr:ABC transporter ATP-binding protein [Gammaproteobacteria bacterium]RZO98088.1 MAG: ABC transporter ATP-binding protein [Gammaproteobacteria bacterium]|tara:strand:+ start:5388 stop:6047 length:660 start_codon:yes stop_codon:yes gene_type:complete
MIIKTRNLSKQILFNKEKLNILSDINLDVEEASSIAITGPSGSGKSTLLSILAGLDLPSSGEVFLADEPLHSLSEEKRALVRKDSVAFVFQNFELLPGLTALENVMLPLELKAKKKAKEVAKNFLIKVDLQDRINHYPKQLSGGEQQRVAIARAFACEAKVLFCDEPTGNLDSKNSQLVVDLLFDSYKDSSSALVIVTHDKQLASRCDRELELVSGKVV